MQETDQGGCKVVKSFIENGNLVRVYSCPPNKLNKQFDIQRTRPKGCPKDDVFFISNWFDMAGFDNDWMDK